MNGTTVHGNAGERTTTDTTAGHGMPAGLRERNMRLKRDRILAAASDLFRQRGFGATTTQEIAARADVASGTVFRYAKSKSELLLMVYNEHLRDSVAEGARGAATVADPRDAVITMIAPLLERAKEDPENVAAYQRELLFGPSSEEDRVAGLALIGDLEEAVAARLTAAYRHLDADQARLASYSIFAITHLAIARLSTGVHAEYDSAADLGAQVTQIIRGITGTETPSGPPTEQERKNGHE